MMCYGMGAGLGGRPVELVDLMPGGFPRKAANSDAAWDKHMRDVASLPVGGEPIKIGHHSERRHRNAIDKAHNSMRRSIDARHDAEEVAAHTTDARDN